MTRQFCNRKVQPVLLFEAGNTEGSVNNHAGIASFEGVLTAIHKAVCTNFMRCFHVRKKGQRFCTCI